MAMWATITAKGTMLYTRYSSAYGAGYERQAWEYRGRIYWRSRIVERHGEPVTPREWVTA